MDEGIKDQGAFAEANAIVHDKSNPKNEAFWRGDQTVADHVQALYANAVPGARGGNDEAINHLFEKPRAKPASDCPLREPSERA